ncbi:MAG: hypothetical protein K0R24_1295, partial [Gammaproteobacteria bacterium]|nr:hypothetical protein [Gammaproteobacteria bacterium]
INKCKRPIEHVIEDAGHTGRTSKAIINQYKKDV